MKKSKTNGDEKKAGNAKAKNLKVKSSVKAGVYNLIPTSVMVPF
jgi:hypothetical protein